jgi:hypothetical protein
MGRQSPIRLDSLKIAAMAFLAANLAHTGDHVRQRMAGVNGPILVAGSILTLTAVAVAVVALRNDRRGPLVASVVGFSAAVAVAASHLAPHWGLFSDSYVDDIHPDAVSWAVMLMEVAAGTALGLAGLARLRALSHRQRRGHDPSNPSSAFGASPTTTAPPQ